MEKIKEYKEIIILILVISAGAFYWYEWRPTQIRKECAQKALYGFGQTFDDDYFTCLKKDGLQK